MVAQARRVGAPILSTLIVQGGGNWDEDERKPTLGPQGRSTGESWWVMQQIACLMHFS